MFRGAGTYAWIIPRFSVASVVHLAQLHFLTFLVLHCYIRYDIYVITMMDSFFSHLFCRDSCFIILYLFTYIGVKRDFHIRLCFCRIVVIQRVPLVDQELEFNSWFLVRFVCVIQSFCIVFCRPYFLFLFFVF